jgi:hypothetical protein
MLGCFLSVIVTSYVAEAQEHVREAVLRMLVRLSDNSRNMMTYDSIQLIIDLRLVRPVTTPGKIASSIMTICIAFLAFISK